MKSPSETELLTVELFATGKSANKPADKAKTLIRPKAKKPAPASSRQAVNLDY